MTLPLPHVGAAALGTLAYQAVRHLKPGEFLRELWGNEHAAQPVKPPVGASDRPDTTPPAVDLVQAVPAFAAKLARHLAAAGVQVNPSQPIVLKDDGRGGVMLDGDHLDRAAIEQVLAEHAGLRADFLAIASAAADQRQHLAVGLLPDEFRLAIHGGEATWYFE
jgi:hypothetical protein